MGTKQSYPKALPFLFLTEMWERFGFYVVQGALVLYTSNYLGLSDARSYTISGMFLSLAYVAPMIGGYIADRILGFKLAIGWGGMFLALGYALLALSNSEATFYLSLATVVVGNGLFKPNISSLLGALYSPDNPHRDSGFTIFYIGINLGILLAGVGSGLLRNYFGWKITFASASIGFLIGLSIFGLGLKWGNMHYSSHVLPKLSKWLNKKILPLYCLIAIGAISFIINSAFLSKWLLPIVGIFLLIFMFTLTARQEARYKKSLALLNILILSSVVFWTLYWQMFLSFNLFIERLVDKNLFGIHIPTTAFYAIESIFIIIFGPILAIGWSSLTQANKNPSTFSKFILATFFVSLACLILAISTFFGGPDHMTSPLWIVIAYLCITLGELLLSPIGLSAVTILSPPHLTGLMMGIWFVALGFGGQFGGAIAKFASIPTVAINDLSLQLLIYRYAFYKYALIGFSISVLLLIIRPIVRRNLDN